MNDPEKNIPITGTTPNRFFPWIQKLFHLFIIFWILSPFLTVATHFFYLDFWNDELYTLRHFTFVNYDLVFSDYHVPNNHIGFNVLNKLFLHAVGINTLESLMDTPWMARVLGYVFAFCTILYTYLISLKWGKPTALLSVALLVTTLPWYVAFLQVRGYGLSMALVSMMVFHLIEGMETQKIYHWIISVLVIAWAILTIPLNIYYILSLLIGIWLSFAFQYLMPFQKNTIIHKGRTIYSFINTQLISVTIIVLLGILIGLLIYIPIWDQVFNNIYTHSNGLFHGKVKGLIKEIYVYLLHGRQWLVAPVIAGFLVTCIQINKITIPQVRRLILLFSVVIFPFVISGIRGDEPPDRAFLMIIPILACLISVLLYPLIGKSTQHPKLHITLTLLFVVLSQVSFRQEYISNVEYLRVDRFRSVTHQNILQSYFSQWFHPHKQVKTFSKLWRQVPYPVVIQKCDHHGFREYLRKYRITYAAEPYFSSYLEKVPRFYVWTATPTYLEWSVKKKYTQLICKNLTHMDDYHQLFYCFCKQNLKYRDAILNQK
jgi:hypothetical protein